MKILFTLLLVAVGLTLHAQVAINTDGTSPDNSAMLDVKSTAKGLLIPRMTLVQRNSIASPATGLLIFQTDAIQGYYYNSGSTASPAWTLVGIGSGWALTGNAGTSSSTNFIGTTDNVPLSFRVNNAVAGIIDPLKFNTSIGYVSLFSNTTGSFNTANGVYALNSNTEGSSNTALGYGTLYSNTKGNQNTANGFNSLVFNNTGSFNTAVGHMSSYSNTTGFSNVAIGVNALNKNTFRSNLVAIGDSALFNNGLSTSDLFDAIKNTAIGSKSLYNNTHGSSNTAVGYQALYANTTGRSNTAIGDGALYANYWGTNNTASGSGALYNNTTGWDNTAIGTGALFNNKEGMYNTAIGSVALSSNHANNRSTAIGYGAMSRCDDRTSGRNTYNTAIGYEALYGNGSTPYTNTGQFNTAIGDHALYQNESGNNNSANGADALFNNSTGNYNTAFGFSALYKNTTGNSNIAIGPHALYNNLDGYANAAIGEAALGQNTTASTLVANVAIGYHAGGSMTTGYGNVLVGESTGQSITTGFDNVWIGKMVGSTGAQSYYNSIAIGESAPVDASNKARIGNAFISSIGGQVGWTTFSDGRFKKNLKADVPGLSFISLLNPVTYNVDLPALQAHLTKAGNINTSAVEDKARHTGFLAQEVEAAAQSIGYDFSGIDKSSETLGLRYAEFVVPLVKAVQEQQKIIEALKSQVEELQQVIGKLAAK